MTIRTIKIPYTCSAAQWGAEYDQLSKQQANAIRFAFNRLLEGKKEKEIRSLISALNNVPMDSWFIQSGIYAAKALYESCIARKQTKVCFGRSALQQYQMGKISKQEFQEARIFGISSVGEAAQKGNRKFNFISQREIIFKPKKGTKFSFEINPSKNQKQYIKAILDLSGNKEAPISVKITKTHLHLSFDVRLMRDTSYRPVKNRIMGVDMNPNRFAFCIKDQNTILEAESFEMMDLRLYAAKGFSSDSKEKKYLNNKKRHEIIELAHYFIKQAKSMHVEAIAVENLKGMRSQGASKAFNRAVNNDFRRNLFISVIEKLCALNNIKYLEILPQYTSFMGCVQYGSILPDPMSAAAQVACAGLHTLNQIKTGIKWTAWFNAPITDLSLYNKSTYLQQWKHEDLCFESVKALYNSVKKLFGAVGATGGMSKSYHTFLCSRGLIRAKHKSEKSSVQGIYVL